MRVRQGSLQAGARQLSPAAGLLLQLPPLILLLLLLQSYGFCPAACPALTWRADDWKWFNKSVPKVVRELHEEGYQIMIIRWGWGWLAALPAVPAVPAAPAVVAVPLLGCDVPNVVHEGGCQISIIRWVSTRTCCVCFTLCLPCSNTRALSGKAYSKCPASH